MPKFQAQEVAMSADSKESKKKKAGKVNPEPETPAIQPEGPEHQRLSEEEHHKRLLAEKEQAVKRREQLKDYRRQFLQKGKQNFDRRNKFSGGTKGRRGS
ncbi:MAG: hypothetical protein L0Y74_04600 [candidate division Zixibacteria bacterium]|nr:hypothetical protein [candidate division Zixibacteria bacterium]